MNGVMSYVMQKVVILIRLLIIELQSMCQVWDILLSLNPECQDLGGNVNRSTVFEMLDLNGIKWIHVNV